jgi:hypothetical protein
MNRSVVLAAALSAIAAALAAPPAAAQDMPGPLPSRIVPDNPDRDNRRADREVEGPEMLAAPRLVPAPRGRGLSLAERTPRPGFVIPWQTGVYQ